MKLSFMDNRRKFVALLLAGLTAVTPRLYGYSIGFNGWSPEPQAQATASLSGWGEDVNGRFVNFAYANDNWNTYLSPRSLDFDTLFYSWPYGNTHYDGCWGDWSNPSVSISGAGVYNYQTTRTDNDELRLFNPGCDGPELHSYYDATNGTTKDADIHLFATVGLVGKEISTGAKPYPYIEYEKEVEVSLPSDPAGIIGYKWSSTGYIKIKDSTGAWVNYYPAVGLPSDPSLRKVTIQGTPGFGELTCSITYKRFPLEVGSPVDTISNSVKDLYGFSLLNKVTPWEYMEEDDIAYVTDVPAMPDLAAYAKIKDMPIGEIDEWHAEVEGRDEREGEDDRQLPPDNPGKQWSNYFSTILFGSEIVGGDITLEHRVGTTIDKTLHFEIKGKNPLDATAKTYIEIVDGPYLWAWAIAKHESEINEQYYNQFNPVGAVNEEKPNFSANGSDHGWGMCQIDRGSEPEVTTAEVWNWQTNVNSMIAMLVEKQDQAEEYMEAVQRTFPSEWEAPPATYTPDGCSTVLSNLEAAIIVLYNSASVIRNLKTGYPAPDDWENYASCWAFDENAASGHRWTFVPNSLNYLEMVITLYEN